MSAEVADHQAIPSSSFRVRSEEPCVRPVGTAGGPGITARLQALLPPGSHLNCDGVKLEDNGMTTEFALPASGSTYCGRDHKTCEVWIPDIHCSRRHAEIVVDRKAGRVGIVRLGSNPTKVIRGEYSLAIPRFTLFDLQDGDVIVFPKEHAFLVSIEREMTFPIGR